MQIRTLFISLFFIAAVNVFAQAANEQFLAADQALMIMPTAYTMPKGSSSFTDYELFLIQYSYAMTSRTHISAGMVFPMAADLLKTFTAGIKQNYYTEEMLQSALWVSYNPYVEGGMFGNVVSLGDKKASLHAAAAWVFSTDKISKDYAVMVGGIASLSPRTSFITEVLSTSQIIDEEGNGIISFGFRFKGEKSSWDIGGGRLLRGNSGLLFLPILKATVMF